MLFSVRTTSIFQGFLQNGHEKTRFVSGLFIKWCRLAELDCLFILTMDTYYRYTKAAAT